MKKKQTNLKLPDVNKMVAAGSLAARTLQMIGEHVRPGVTTEALDVLVHEYTLQAGATPSPLGYHGFPKSCCTSVNNVVCHGIPGPYVLKDGDIVNIDVTSDLDGFHGDTSATFFVGEVSAEAKRVVEVARQALQVGISVVKDGVRLGDIGAVIQEYVESQGCSVVREYGGHGIGSAMHMLPHVFHIGSKGVGERLRAGQCITIEPMVNLGAPEVELTSDGWAVVTMDSSLSAQFEHSLLITKDGCLVLTQRDAPLKNSEPE